MAEGSIEIYETEDRTFPPPPGFAAAAEVSDQSMYDEAAADFEAFWARQARDLLDWDTDFGTTLEWDLPFAKWFVGGELNVSYNCLDRHVAAGKGDRVAFHWEGEPGDTRTITYSGLLDDVQRFANVLLRLGLRKGDRIAVYMPMIPELAVTMLACTRIGVAHSVIFGGFSPDAITDRCTDAEARLVVTADAGYRRGAPAALKPNVDLALAAGAPSVEHVVVVDRCGTDPAMVEGRDLWWHDLMAESAPDCPAEPMDSEQLLYLLYTSGTTAKPKGIMHTTGGYLDPGGVHPPLRVRPAPRLRRVLVRGRHRLGDRPQLHRVRAAGQRGHVGDVRGHARTRPAQKNAKATGPSGPRTACGTSSSATASPSSTPPPPPSARS